MLQLKSLGIDDLMKFEWVTNPPAESILRALEHLVGAGMIGEDGRLTPVGEKVAECPVEVSIARMVGRSSPWHTQSALKSVQLFSSKDHKCGEEILTIAAMVAVQVSTTQLSKSGLSFHIPRISSSFLKEARGHLPNWREENLPRKKASVPLLSMLHSI